MPEPKILFNSSSGSDTQASGAGPATAIFGTGASLNSTTSVDLSADSPNLSGVATDGSACLWVNTATGRQFAKITAVNNTTKIVTVALAYGVTATGLTWAIGGKRATLDDANSRKLFGTATGTQYSLGWQAGWECVLETDQIITSTLILSGPGATGFAIFRSNTPGTIRTITCSANQAALDWVIAGWISTFQITDIKIQNSNATKTSAHGIISSGSGSARTLLLRRCIIGDPSNTLQGGVTTTFSAIDCCFQNCAGKVLTATGNFNLYGCVFRNNTGNPTIETNGGVFSIVRCLFHNNSNDNLQMNHSQIPGTAFIADCTFDEAGGSALSNLLGSGGANGYHAINCNLTKSGAFGMRGGLLNELPNSSATNCNFGSGADANTSGAYNSGVLEYNNLTVNGTYANRSGKDYSPAAGIKAKGLPLSPATLGASQAVPTSSIDIGSFQSAGGGGGSIFFRPGMSGGMNE